MKRIFVIFLLLVATISAYIYFNKKNNNIVNEKTILSPVYNVDGIYKSMMGPSSTEEIKLIDSQEPELIWITAFKAEMVNEYGNSQISQEFMCHSNLDMSPSDYKNNLKKNISPSSRLFTLSQGQYEINFPEGFGIPILSNEVLKLTTQVLNLNDIENDIKVRHKIKIKYIRNKDINTPLKPLMMVGAAGLKSLNEFSSYYNIARADKEIHGESCMIGENTKKKHIYKDRYGQEFTGHWVVKPGREVTHTNVTKFMQLPFDTTLHYIAVHIHPFAETLELKDLTTNTTIFKSNVTNSENKIGVDHVEYFESTDGINLYKDHQYQLISVYNNNTKFDQDSMAVMYLYVLDKDFSTENLDEDYL